MDVLVERAFAYLEARYPTSISTVLALLAIGTLALVVGSTGAVYEATSNVFLAATALVITFPAFLFTVFLLGHAGLRPHFLPALDSHALAFGRSIARVAASQQLASSTEVRAEFLRQLLALAPGDPMKRPGPHQDLALKTALAEWEHPGRIAAVSLSSDALLDFLPPHGTLTVVSGPSGADVGTTYRLRGSPVQLGRARPSLNSIVLNDPEVSLQHAVLDHDRNGSRLSDNFSTNGTFVNGLRIKTAALKPGDRITMGATVLEYQAGSLRDE